MSGSDPMKFVMHSSVKEFKDSYMGLYPVEENWFSDSIRTYHDNGRYLRYIKDEDARQFAAYAHKLEQYNVQIASLALCRGSYRLVSEINGGLVPANVNIGTTFFQS